MNHNHHAQAFIERIVSVEEECRGLRGSIREIYNEAKEAGFTKGAIRIVVKRRLEDEDQRRAREVIETEADQIMAVLGMLRDTPLGEAAVERARRPRGRPRKNNGATEEVHA